MMKIRNRTFYLLFVECLEGNKEATNKTSSQVYFREICINSIQKHFFKKIKKKIKHIFLLNLINGIYMEIYGYMIFPPKNTKGFLTKSRGWHLLPTNWLRPTDLTNIYMTPSSYQLSSTNLTNILYDIYSVSYNHTGNLTYLWVLYIEMLLKFRETQSNL